MTRNVIYSVWYISLIAISLTLMSSSRYASNSNSNSNSTYYVDIKGGSDSNDGTSQSKAWKSLEKANSMTFNPGDKLLFKAGGVWNGQLHPKGSGSDSNPIIIDMYGTGNKPVIAGGAATYAKNRTIGTVYLVNQSYWEINNLEITAKDPANTTLGWRQGIVITAAGARVNHVYVNNCYIHDIFGNIDKQGGICFNSEAPDSMTPTGFKDIRATGNNLFNISNAGITEMYNRVGKGSRGEDPGTAMFNQNKNTGFIVSGNYLHSIFRNVIIIRTDDGAIVERNVVHHANYFNGAKSGATGNSLWGIMCQNTTYQYNEGYLKQGGTKVDPGFIHNDFKCHNDIVQYNYSHNNEGGLWDGGYYNNTPSTTIIRYNISQNDIGPIIRMCSWSQDDKNTPEDEDRVAGNFKVYNNVIYMNTSFTGKVITNEHVKIDDGKDVYYNNIFYNLSSGTGQYQLLSYSTFDYNLFYGNQNGLPSDAHMLTSDPMFVSACTAKENNTTPPSANITLCDGYKLKSGSPALGSGVLIPDNGGKDFFGNQVSSSAAPNRGAYNGIGISR